MRLGRHAARHGLTLAALAAGACAPLGLTSCSGGPTVSFSGTPRAVAADAEMIELIGGEDPRPPSGYELLGVVTTRCTALNGAGGLIDGPCTEESMLEAAQRRAAEVGGTALYAPACRESVLDREVRYEDGGTIRASVRTQVQCQGSVLRAAGLAPGQRATPAATASATAPRSAAHVVSLELSGVVVEVTLPEGSKPAATDGAAVGELPSFPAGHRDAGQLSSRCMRGCARATARRGLLRGASRMHALAVSDIQCLLSGERWQCHGRAVGERIAAPSASPSARPAVVEGLARHRDGGLDHDPDDGLDRDGGVVDRELGGDAGADGA